MKLLLRRTQGAAILGKPTFALDVRAELSDDERARISKYKLGDTTLFSRYEMTDRGKGLLGLISRIIFKMRNLTITVNNLTNGKHIECKDVVEMLAIEEHIREAGRTFISVLRASTHFGGEEVVEL